MNLAPSAAAAACLLILATAAAQDAAPAPRTVRQALDAGIAWLVAHQDEDGGWSASLFLRHDPKGEPCTGAGKPDQDFHVTALATVALLATGNTAEVGKYREQMAKALDWLERRIGKDGFLGEPSAANATAAHAIACFALTEGMALSDRRPPTAPLQRLLQLRLPDGTWSARPGETKGDAAATHWACCAMLSGRPFGDAAAFDFAPTIAFADQHPEFMLPESEVVLRVFAQHERAKDT